jgi:hypothetical protein
MRADVRKRDTFSDSFCKMHFKEEQQQQAINKKWKHSYVLYGTRVLVWPSRRLILYGTAGFLIPVLDCRRHFVGTNDLFDPLKLIDEEG